MTWLGDGLVIYRCFVIWNEDFYVILLPSLLLVISIAIQSTLLYAFRHSGLLPSQVQFNLTVTVYPMNFVQNTLTTGLIAFKIWRQHRQSVAAGVRPFGSSLIGVMRVVIESALLYTLELLFLIILSCRESYGQFVVRAAAVPSIGIVFNLIAVRVHLTQAKSHPTDFIQDLSTWLCSEAEEATTPSVADMELATHSKNNPTSRSANS